MNPFIQQLVDDLKKFSAELLAPGLHVTQPISTNIGTVSSTTALLKSIELLTTLIPKLVAELQTTDATRKVMLHYTPVPKRATFSHRPTDYQQDAAKRLLPAHWLSILPLPEVDTSPLRWLLYLLDKQENALTKIENRTTKYIDNCLQTQQGESSYAQNDRATLLGMRSRLYEAQTKLEHARSLLLRTVQSRIVPSHTLPDPYPRTAAWTRLRRYAQQLINPNDYLPNFLHRILNSTLEIADTPYLYQRWCGIKILAALEEMGWIWNDDPIGALFLGGEITLKKAEIKINLWIEPRLSKYKTHPSGFTSQENLETQPDYMIITPGPYGMDAYIIDPTTTADIEIRRTKAKYLTTIETAARVLVAGIPTIRNPLRAWSAAPLHKEQCELGDKYGYTGTIPMHPLDWTKEPLKEWLREIDRYALAWGKFALS